MEKAVERRHAHELQRRHRPCRRHPPGCNACPHRGGVRLLPDQLPRHAGLQSRRPCHDDRRRTEHPPHSHRPGLHRSPHLSSFRHCERDGHGRRAFGRPRLCRPRCRRALRQIHEAGCNPGASRRNTFIRTCTSGEEAQWKGVRMRSEWVGRPLPIYMAVDGPRACRLAGELADGVVFLGVHPEHVKWRLELIEEGARKADRRLSDIEVCVRGVVYPSRSKEDALAGLSPHVAGLEYIHRAFRNPTPAMAELRRRLDRADPGVTETLMRDYDRFAAKRQRGDEHEWARAVSRRSLDFFSLAGPPRRDHPSHRGAGQAGRLQHIHHALYPDEQEPAHEIDIGHHHARFPRLSCFQVSA